MKNTKTAKTIRLEDEGTDFNSQIELILENNSSWEIELSLMKKQVLDVLWWDKQKAIFLLKRDIELFEYLPMSLQKDTEILTLVVQKKPDRYNTLPQKLQQDSKIQKVALSSIITSWDICEFIAIILKFPNDRKLKVLAESLLHENPEFLAHWHNALIYDIFKNERKVYDLIMQKWLLEISQHWVSLWSQITTTLQKILLDLEWCSPEDVQENIFSQLLVLLWLKKPQLWERSHKLLDILVSSVKTTQKASQESEDQLKDDVFEDEDTDIQEYEDPPSVGPYYYSSMWNTSRVLDPDGSSVVVDTKIFESMSEKSLENFMNFSKLIKYLWLSFLLEKQERRIQIATGIDFYEGEWMSPAKILKFLNSVGKNIWIPEESFKNKQGETKVWCFDTLWAAKHKFREIRESQRLWDINLSWVNTWGKWVVEVYMKSVWLLTQPFGEISIAKWK